VVQPGGLGHMTVFRAPRGPLPCGLKPVHTDLLRPPRRTSEVGS